MFDNDAKDAISLLKADHERVKALFEAFEKAEDEEADKKQIVESALTELKVHATLEEEIFYPAARAVIGDEEDLMEEANEEHHVAKVLIAELEEMEGKEPNFDAKFIVLAENIRHHIKEEEGEMFPKLKSAEGIDLEALGEKMARRKEVLLTEGVPEPVEASSRSSGGRSGTRKKSSGGGRRADAKKASARR